MLQLPRHGTDLQCVRMLGSTNCRCKVPCCRHNKVLQALMIAACLLLVKHLHLLQASAWPAGLAVPP